MINYKTLAWWLLIVVLCLFVWREAGPFTAALLLFISVRVELNQLAVKTVGRLLHRKHILSAWEVEDIIRNNG